MPEGPEVFVMTSKFAKRFPPGSLLQHVTPLHSRYKVGKDKIPEQFSRNLPLTIQKVTSKGKKTIVFFKNSRWTMLISYSMTGHFEINSCKHCQLELTFDSGSYFWVCSRNLTTCLIEFIDILILREKLAKLGLDIIRDNPSWNTIVDTFGTSKKNICAFLMEQTKFCGIGNYLKAVVLYRCHISPYKKVHELADDEKWQIWVTAKIVAKEAILSSGMGIRDYKDESGKVVGVSFDITPYSKKMDLHGNSVVHEKIAGRTTWFVPKLQCF